MLGDYGYCDYKNFVFVNYEHQDYTGKDLDDGSYSYEELYQYSKGNPMEKSVFEAKVKEAHSKCKTYDFDCF